MRPSSELAGTRSLQALCVSTLTEAVVDKINNYTLDLLLNQRHYLSWKPLLAQSEFLRLRGFAVLLPIGLIGHPVLTATHIYIETHENSLVFLLRDESANPLDEISEDVTQDTVPVVNTYILRCQKFPQQPFFITTLYHTCYL